MGYRSCVALALYGTPSKVELVENMFEQGLEPEYDRPLFERVRQVKDQEIKYTHSLTKRRTVLWTFDDIKWYGEMDSYKDKLFSLVDEVNDAVPDHERDFYLAVEFVRVGESDDDTERQTSVDADCDMYVSRKIELPNGFEWKV